MKNVRLSEIIGAEPVRRIHFFFTLTAMPFSILMLVNFIKILHQPELNIGWLNTYNFVVWLSNLMAFALTMLSMHQGNGCSKAWYGATILTLIICINNFTTDAFSYEWLSGIIVTPSLLVMTIVYMMYLLHVTGIGKITIEKD